MNAFINIFKQLFKDTFINTLSPRQSGRHFANVTFKCIFLNENIWIPIKISLRYVPKSPINNITALVQIMAWRRPGDKPLSEPMMVSLPTHICITRPQWVNIYVYKVLNVDKMFPKAIIKGTIYFCVIANLMTIFPKHISERKNLRFDLHLVLEKIWYMLHDQNHVSCSVANLKLLYKTDGIANTFALRFMV